MTIWSALAALPQPDSFRAESALPTGTIASGVYVLRDLAGEVVYVGQSCDIARRLTEHRLRGEITFHRAEWCPCLSWHERLRIEGVLILALSPRHNRGLALGKRNDGRWYQIGSPDQNEALIAGPPVTGRAARAPRRPRKAARVLAGAAHAHRCAEVGDAPVVAKTHRGVAARG